jgi:two-component system, cell cycle sensor histidine kinase and response regulator CckA
VKTRDRSRTPTRTTALKIAGVYAVVGALWILFSGRLLHQFVHDPSLAATLETVKGWAYVVVTAVLFGWWLNRYFRDIRRTTQLLQKSEARFSTIFSDSPVAIAITRVSDDILVDANEAFVQLYGYPREEILGRTAEQMQLWQSDSRARVIAELREREHVATDMQGRRKDGETRDLLASLQRIELDGEPCVLSTLVDVTERKRAELERANLEAQLRQAQKMESIGRLAGGVAHDFNNLLMGIMGYAELSREAVAADHPVAPWLDEITAAAQRSAGIARQLLTFARKQTISPTILNLDDHVAGTLELLRRLIGEDIDLVWHPAAQQARVRMDPSQVDQILANLVVNARDAMVGVGTLSIETAETVLDAERCADLADALPGPYVVLTVGDSGCGMDRATMERIFEPFFTTKDPGKGTGLGLATVYGIVQQNGGSVDVFSEPGAGTTFRVYIPRLAAEETDAGGSVPPIDTGEGSETVLLVEDDRSVRATAELFLQTLGYTVLTAPDPEAALELAAGYDGDIHILVTDVIMPGMNGRDLAATLTATFPRMACLFVSGYTADIIANHGVLDENVQFLAKPFTRADLARALREALRHKQSDETH